MQVPTDKQGRDNSAMQAACGGEPVRKVLRCVNFEETKRWAKLTRHGIAHCPACDRAAPVNGYVYREQIKWF